MVNVAQQNQKNGASSGATNEQDEQKMRRSRGLRTLAHDIAEFKRNGQKVTPEVPVAEKRGQAPQDAASLKPKGVGEKSIESPAIQKQSTHYRAELEKLAEKYIPEKPQTPPTASSQSRLVKPTNDALKSFEMNKAFNDQLHKTTAPISSEAGTQKQETPAPKLPLVATQKSVVPTSARNTEEKKSESEVARVEQPKDKKLTELTEEDINREMERVLSTQKESKASEAHSPTEVEVREKKEEQKKPERPQTSRKQLEETLANLSQRIESSASRIATYRDEERAANTSLKNLFERRDIINKNLDPVSERERAVLEAIKALEEKEGAATNKIEKRDAENRRWEKENERRELEDERWRLEEIFDKLRLVIEKTEYELVSIGKKRTEEEAHKKELEGEKVLTETHRSLLVKREERDVVERKSGDIQKEVTNLKNELKVIRSTEEGLEKEKKELEGKIGALNDLGTKHSLEKERRHIEDKLHETEESRWAREDELKKYYAEKDEKDRELKILTTEIESLEVKLEGLESEEKTTNA